MATLVGSAVLPHRMQIVELFSWLKYVKSTISTRIMELLNEVYSVCEKEVNDTSNDEEMTSLMHVLIREYRKSMDFGRVNDTAAKLVMMMVFLGATGTLGIFSCQIGAVIAHYPAIQERINNEIDDVIGVLEVLRNCVLAVAESPHLTLEDTTLGGYDIPAGNSCSNPHMGCTP